MERPSDPTSPLSALPSAGARALAFGAILVAGACGALIGFAIVDLETDGNGLLSGLGAIVGGILAAAGVSVVAVLVLRAMGEWRAQQEREAEEL